MNTRPKVSKTGEVSFIYAPICMGWPAYSNWPRLLAHIHGELGRATHQIYYDKDIMVPCNLQWNTEHGSYQQLAAFDVYLIRFNERCLSNEGFDLRAPDYRIKLHWAGNNVVGFDWERLPC